MTTTSVWFWNKYSMHQNSNFALKVQRIPETFDSVEQYLGSYVNPLLEEIRAELQSSMEVVHRAPYAEIISSKEAKPCGTKLYQIRVDHWRNKDKNGGRKEPYKTLPGDVFILAHVKPQSVFDVQRAGKPWAFLSLVSFKDDGNATTCFTVKASKEFEHKTKMFLIFLVNLIPQKRIWEALHMSSNVKLINKVLRVDSAVKNKCVECCGKTKCVWDEKMEDSSSSKLNPSQIGAICSCLHMLQCKSGSSFELIWGPPGTGKTKTVSTLIVSLLRSNCKTLVCAPTNVAITEVASRVVKMVSDSQPRGLLHSFGDILLFGTKERLNIGSDIEDIYLDHRVEKLAECFGPIGLKHCFTSMINLLESCVFQYRLFVENNKNQSNEGRVEEIGRESESVSEDGKKNSNSFLEYLRQRFDSALSKLESSVLIAFTHTVTSYISKKKCQNMASIIRSLDSFRALLFQADVDSEALEELFSRREAIEEVSRSQFDITSLLLSTKRSECLSFLRTIQGSLNGLDYSRLKSKFAMKKFCFENALLIFCTVSSSAKLHKMGVKPTMLIIDEAAQLKECESTIPLQLPGLKYAIFVGDEWQLPATVKSKISVEAGFGRSLFERLSSQNHPKHLLNMQYRMHPSISIFPNSEFYNKQIQDAEIVGQKSHEKRYLPGSMFGPYSFINIVGGMEEREADGHSFKNMVEIAFILKILQNLHKVWLQSQCELSIGIVSPYAAQVAAIQVRLGKQYDNIHGFQVKAKTVDGFQGGEEDIIIMSTVRSGKNCSLQFISKPQRINVALTRARHSLWILGSERTLANSRTVWEAIVTDAKNRGCFFNADFNKDFSEAIVEVKKELGQFDDILFNFKGSKWKVFFSDNFMKSFKKLTSFVTRKAVIDLLMKLSDGRRPRGRIAAVSRSSLEVKSFKVSNLCIISTVDIELIDSGYTQVLRIWDLLPLKDIPELVTHLECIFKEYSEDFTDLCNEKCLEGNLEFPRSWPATLDITRFKGLSLAESGMDLVASTSSNDKTRVVIPRFGEISLGIKFYSLSNCVMNHMLSDRDTRELDLTFGLADQEEEIVLFHRSAFVLGRSGTGKTSILITKLFKKEYLHSKATDRFNGIGHVDRERVVEKMSAEAKGNVLRQLFVTASFGQCNLVKRRLSFLTSNSSHSAETKLVNTDGNDCEETEFKNVPQSFHNVPLDAYPLIITFRQFLLMLDKTLSESFFGKFINMLELQIQNPSSISDVLQFLIRTKEVDHERFSSQYWPRLVPQFKKKLDPSIVFTEIVSHIKGSLPAMEAADGKLARENYVASTKGCWPNISRKKRECIYDIFEIYEQMKAENGEFDLADFINDLHLRLKRERYKGDEMNYVYVDEVQDLTMSQFALFRHVCSNVEEGFVFAGDTIKTLLTGANFRIDDIRSLFYKKFVSGSKGKHIEIEEKNQITKMFHLTRNFHTHSGILNLSHSIVELLNHFFAHSVDTIEPETTNLHGDPPVLLQSGNNEDALLKIFGECQNIIRSVDFGAEQVIVVRDESNKKRIKNHVGEKAMIMTISECKDLKFQDVLLYNFFGSSPLKKHWKVISEDMKKQGSFDSKHNILLDELKHLYVAISSSKRRLWICDDAELSEPMFVFWKKKCLVQAREVDDLLAWEMQVSSTSKEWKSRGIELYYKHNYEMATFCFEKACETFWEKKSRASGLEARAHRMHSFNPAKANSLLSEATKIYKDIGMTDCAARYSCDSEDYGRAGREYLASFYKSGFQIERDRFSMVDCYKLAAEVYAKHSLSSECLAVCAKGKLFDMGLKYLQCWKQRGKQKHDTTSGGKELERIEQEFLESYALHCYEVKDTKSMMKVVKSFASMNLVHNFLRSLGCLDELLSLEVESGNFVKAAEIAKLQGDVSVAATLLGKAEKFREAATLILSYVLSSSLWSSGKKGWPLKLFKQKNSLLTKAKLLAENETQSFYEFVCLEADVMENKKTDLVMRKNELNASRIHKSFGGEILSTWKILDAHLALAISKYLCEENLVLDLTKHSEDIVSQNQVSIVSLVYFWNLWKQKIIGIFEYLRCLGTKYGGEFKDHGEFCLSFLGVWRQFYDTSTTYVLLNSDADWAKNTEKRCVCNGGTLVSVDAGQFVSAARSYWSSEVLSVGFAVLQKLEELYKTMNQTSDLLFGKCRTLSPINEVAEFLLQSEFLNRTDKDSQTLEKFMRLSIDDFVGHVFPFDSQKASMDSLSKHEGNLPMGYASFWGIFEGLNSEESGRHEMKFTMKLDVDKYVRLLTRSLQTKLEFEGANLSVEMFHMIDELEQLSAALDARNTSVVKQLSKILQSRRPRMEGVLNQLFHQQKTDQGNERLKTIIASSSQCDNDTASTSARNISEPIEGDSKASQAGIAPENKAKVAATGTEESGGGCHIL